MSDPVDLGRRARGAAITLAVAARHGALDRIAATPDGETALREACEILQRFGDVLHLLAYAQHSPACSNFPECSCGFDRAVRSVPADYFEEVPE